MHAPITGEDTITFGKFAGNTYQFVYRMNQSYCRWVLNTTIDGDANGELHRFGEYITRRIEKDTRGQETGQYSLTEPHDMDL